MEQKVGLIHLLHIMNEGMGSTFAFIYIYIYFFFYNYCVLEQTSTHNQPTKCEKQELAIYIYFLKANINPVRK